MSIIVYIHICQIGEWKRTFHMIMDAIVKSELYEIISEIRCGVLNYNVDSVHDEECISIYNPKIRIVYIGTPQEYERPTLLHMRNAAEKDPPCTKYIYLHTKGIRWYGTPNEPCVIDWIKLLIYWNVERWRDAVEVLNSNDTYGCNYHSGTEYPLHYSGNFFWTTSRHVMTLPNTIGPGYNDPEFWICSAKQNANDDKACSYYNAFSSNLGPMEHYIFTYPEANYRA